MKKIGTLFLTGILAVSFNFTVLAEATQTGQVSQGNTDRLVQETSWSYSVNMYGGTKEKALKWNRSGDATYEYDTLGRVSKKTQHFYNEENKMLIPSGCYTYEYDSNNLLTKKEHYNLKMDSPYLDATYIYEYDTYGNEIKCTTITPNIQHVSRTGYEYDDAARIVKKILLSDAGENTNIYDLYTYNLAGQLASISYYNNNGLAYTIYYNKYDSRGNYTETIGANNARNLFTYEYDNNGNITRKDLDNGGSPTYTQYYYE